MGVVRGSLLGLHGFKLWGLVVIFMFKALRIS